MTIKNFALVSTFCFMSLAAQAASAADDLCAQVANGVAHYFCDIVQTQQLAQAKLLPLAGKSREEFYALTPAQRLSLITAANKLHFQRFGYYLGLGMANTPSAGIWGAVPEPGNTQLIFSSPVEKIFQHYCGGPYDGTHPVRGLWRTTYTLTYDVATDQARMTSLLTTDTCKASEPS